VDFGGCDCELVEDLRCSTRFCLRPRSDLGWDEQMTGAESSKDMFFDAAGSTMCRAQWVSALQLAMASREEVRTRTLSNFLCEKEASTAETAQAPGNPRKTVAGDSVFDREGRKLMENAETYSADALFESLPGKLFVGNILARNSPDFMQTHGVTRVVNCLEPGSFPEVERRRFEGVQYLDFPIALWEDCGGVRTDEGIARVMAPLLGFVSEAVESGESVLIHCFAGAHRGGSAGIACLMHLQDLGRDEAIAEAQAKRSEISAICNMLRLLSKLDKVRGTDVLTSAIAAAREQGYAEAVATAFEDAFEEERD
jgi:hypothetical protein